MPEQTPQPLGAFRSEPFACPATPEALRAHNVRTREAALDIVGRPPFEEEPALNPRVVEEVDDGPCVRMKVRYGNESDDVVWAWLVVPKDAPKPAPAILCLAGSFMTPNWGKHAVVGLFGPENEGDPEAYGANLAERGYVTLSPDYPCTGERVHEGLRQYDTADLDTRFPTWTRVGMSLWDVKRALDFLETRPEVDAGRIGCTGWSQGGDMTVWGAAMDERIRVVISVCGWSPWRGGRVAAMTAPYNYPRLRTYAETGTPIPTDMDHVAARIAPRAFLNISGDLDETVPSQETELPPAEAELAKVYEMFGAGERFQALHLPHRHRYSAEAAAVSREWFARWL